LTKLGLRLSFEVASDRGSASTGDLPRRRTRTGVARERQSGQSRALKRPAIAPALAGAEGEQHMLSRFKILLGCLGALFALSVIGVGVAQAARPVQPHFTVNGGETLSTHLTIEDNSTRGRLWSTELGVVIRCEKDRSEGLIEPRGRGTENKVTYSECKLFATKENAATKQIEEGEELTKCVVGTEGTLVTKLLKARVVWSKGSPTLLLLAFEPETGNIFINIVISGTGCLAAGTDPVEGSVLGLIPRSNVELIATPILFNTINENKKVVQEAKEFEVEESAGVERVVKTGLELTLAGKPSALETGDQIERVREPQAAPTHRALAGLKE
jgi:hypothetical protein